MCSGVIDHVKQPNDVSCGLAAVSMVSRVPLPKIIEIAKTIFDHDPMEVGLNSVDIYDLFVKLHVNHTPMWPIRLEFNNVYFTTVPSLNQIGKLHYVVFDMTNVFEVLDPNRGRPGKKYYITGRRPKNELEHELFGYSGVIQIHGPWEK